MNKPLQTLFCLLLGTNCFQVPLSAQSIASLSPVAAVLSPAGEQKQEKRRLKDVLRELEDQYQVSIAYPSGALEALPVDAGQLRALRQHKNLEASLQALLQELPLQYRRPRAGFYILSPAGPGAAARGGEEAGPAPARQQAAVKLSGKVTDKDNGEGLPGVSVSLKGTAIGTITEADGSYRLEVAAVPAGATLVFSFIGYVSQELPLGNQSVLNIALAPDVHALSEVVVTALGIARQEKSLGYAVQKIDTKSMTQARETNFVNSLQGKVSGVQITGAAGNIGGSSRIVIRGSGSVSGNNQPLFIVDGTPIDNSSFNSQDTQTGNGGRDYGNAGQDINPDDIESISVLKGPSAAALYGSRAANGVVLVTTKSGKDSPGLGLSFNSGATFDQVYLLPRYQNEYGGGFKQAFDLYQGEPVVNFSADESWGPRLDGRLVRQWDSFLPGENFGQLTPWVAHPDNVKDFYQTGTTFTNHVAVTSGSEKAHIRLSYTNLNQQGTMPNSQMKRNTLSLNTTTQLTPQLSASAKVSYVNTRVHGRPVTGDYVGNGPMSVVSSFNTWFQRQLDLSAMKNYRNPDGSQRTWNMSGPEDFRPFYWDNPYFELYEAYSEDQRERVFGNVSLAYALTPHLTVTGFARSDFYDFRIADRAPQEHVNGSMFLKDIRRVKENNYEVLAQYQRELSADFTLALNAGANARRENYNQNYGRTNGGLNVPNFFSLQASVDRPDVIDYTRRRSVNSVYGSATLDYRGILYLDGSLRNDWSSTLPVDNNSYLYPAAAASFVFTDLLPHNRLLSFGKLRAGWARVGNDTDPYRLGLTYSPNNPFGSNQIYNVPDVRNNPVLRPERTASYEIGEDLRFLNGRLGLDATYYYKATTDQILDLPISGTTGYGFAIVNAGKITNRGLELVLTGSPVQVGEAFRWDVALNWARNRNLVVALAEGQENYQLGITNTSDVSVNARVGQPYGTLVGTGFARHENGQRLIDSKGFYVPAPGQVLGSTLPDYTGGLSNTFTYRGFTLASLLDFRKGGKVYSITSETGTYAGLLAETTGLNDKGRPVRDAVEDGGGIRLDGVLAGGEPNTTYIRAASYWKDSNIDEMHVFDASFIKLREVRLGYTFPKIAAGKLPLQRLSLSLVARNLAVLLRRTPHFDPETTLGSGNVQGIESAQLPSVRSFGINLNASF